MRLLDALDQINQIGENKVIYAKRPWALESEAEIGVLDENLRVPTEMAVRGLEYFLEVSVANEVLGVFGQHKPTMEQQRALLMYYAENDAYPQWVYEL